MKIGAFTVARMGTVWPKLDPNDLDGTFETWLAAARPIITAQHTVSARTAVAYLKASKSLQLGRVATIPPVVEQVNAEALRTSLLVTGPISVKQAMTRGVDIVQAMTTADASSSAAAARYAQNGGRDTIVATVNADKDAKGWTWVTGGEKPCDYCSNLDGVHFYLGEEQFKPHDGCNCNPEPGY